MLIGRRQDSLDAAADSIRERGGSAQTAAVDVRDYDKLAAALKEIGPIDIVVCASPAIFRPR